MFRCSIEELKHGFIVDMPRLGRRVPVRVTLADTGFRVRSHGPGQLELFDDLCRPSDMDSSPWPHTTLIDHRRLIDLVLERVLPRDLPRRANGWRDRQGRIGDACRDLAKRIYAQWLRLATLADPTIRNVQKAVYIHDETHPHLLHETELYRDRYLVSDICQYPAAALSVPIAYELAELRDYHLSSRSTSPAPGFYFAPPADRSIPPATQVIALLKDWQGLYSPTCRAYRSLSRTLMHLRGGITSKLLAYLAEIQLERPFTDRLELLTLLLAQSHLPPRAKTAERLRPFMFATRAQILAGMHDVGEFLGQTLLSLRISDVGSFVNFVVDAPAGAQDLPTCVRRAIRWHHQEGWRQAQAGQPHPSTPTQQPGIPLPRKSNIRFLSSVGDIIAESVEMKHCIASYAERAVRGDCYLFHVDYEDQQASVEVDPSGHVRQARGPRNTCNRACQYGQRVLRRWGKQLRVAS